jgi:hypothetical protein
VRGEATRRAIRGTWAMSVPMERAGKGNGRSGIRGVGRGRGVEDDGEISCLSVW